MDDKKQKVKVHYREIIEDSKSYILKVDSDTGDVIAKYSAKPRKKTSNYFTEGEFLTMHYENLCKMLEEKKDYNNLTFRLLFALLRRIEFNNRIRTFRQVELAKKLQSHQQHISTSLKTLEKDGIIKKKEHDYYFTPKFIRFVNDGFDHLAETAEDIENMEATTGTTVS